MREWISADGPIWDWVNRFGNFVLVSLLWLVCCIPVVTIGSATTAMYYTTVKVLRKDKGYVAKEFFHSFKENLKNGTIFTVIYIGIALILYLDITYVVKVQESKGGLFMMVYYIIILLMSSILMYLFPNLSRFKMGKLDLLKLSFYMAFRHFPITLVLILICVGTGILVWLITVPCILFMPSIACFLSSLLLERVMLKYMAKPKPGSEEAKKWYYQ